MKPGYKQTDLGMIPADWEVVEIGDLNPFVTSGSRGWAEFYSDMGFPFIRITNLSRESISLDLTDLKLVKLPYRVSEGTRTQLENDDVLISITADIGIIGYVTASVQKPAYINQHIALVRFDSAKANARFASYFLACERSQRLFRASTDQGAKAGMSLGAIRKIRLALPLAPEQRAIAAALSDVDALIGALEKLIAKKRDIRQGAIQRLLSGKQRLPGFGGHWEVKRLGDLAALHRENVTPAGFPDQMFVHFSIPAFDCGKVPVVEPGSAIGSGKFRVPINAVLVSKLNPRIPRVWAPNAIPLNSVASTEFLVLKPRAEVSRRFLCLICSSAAFVERMQLSATGTTGSHQRINPWDALNIEVAVPVELEEQRAIAAVLNDMDAEIAALQKKRDKTRALKQGMMQELLTGRIRLPMPAEEEVAATP